MGFLDRIQAHPQAHQLLMELPAFWPMEERDLDRWRAHEAAGVAAEWRLREREERRRRIPGCWGSSDCFVGKRVFLFWMVCTIELIFREKNGTKQGRVERKREN